METDRAVSDMTPDSIGYLARDLGWDVFGFDSEQKKLRLTRGETKIDVWLSSKGTVAVMQKGKPATYYRYVVEKKLDELLSES